MAVATPGKTGTPQLLAAARRPPAPKPGLTTNRAPASTARSTCSGVSTVPAPTSSSGSAAIARIASAAAAVRKVTSTVCSPPAASASASGSAVAGVVEHDDREDPVTDCVNPICSVFVNVQSRMLIRSPATWRADDEGFQPVKSADRTLDVLEALAAAPRPGGAGRPRPRARHPEEQPARHPAHDGPARLGRGRRRPAPGSASACAPSRSARPIWTVTTGGPARRGARRAVPAGSARPSTSGGSTAPHDRLPRQARVGAPAAALQRDRPAAARARHRAGQGAARGPAGRRRRRACSHWPLARAHPAHDHRPGGAARRAGRGAGRPGTRSTGRRTPRASPASRWPSRWPSRQPTR